MPNCFQLFPVGSTTPDKLSTVDEKLCSFLGDPVHPNNYCRMWYDIEGWGFAMGWTWDKMREVCPERKNIIDWFEANYTVNAWAEVGRR